MRIHAIMIGLIFLLSAFSVIAASEPLELLEPDKYETYTDGKPMKHCKNCEMKFRICDDGTNIDNTLSLSYNDIEKKSIQFDDKITDMKTYIYKTVTYPNSSTETRWFDQDFNDVKNIMDSAKISPDKCRDMMIKFELKDNAQVDIIPRYNNRDYTEYAWFFAPEIDAGLPMIYMPFNENITSYPAEIAGPTIAGFQYNCSTSGLAGADMDFLADSNWSAFVNSSDPFPYGRMDFDGNDDRCQIEPSGDIDEMAINMTEDWHFRAWFTLRDTSENRFMYHMYGVTDPDPYIGIGVITTNNTKLNVRIRDDLRAEEQDKFYSIANINDGNPHLVIVNYDASESNISIYIDNQFDTSTTWGPHNLSLDHAYIADRQNLDDRWDGLIDELVFQTGVILDADERQQVWEVSNRSSLITGMTDIVEINITDIQSINVDHNATDVIDTITWYINDTSFDIDSATGVMNRSVNPVGVYHVTVNVTDGFDNWATDTFIINVVADNVAPVISSPGFNQSTYTTFDDMTFSITLTDADVGDTMEASFRWTNDSGDIKIDTLTGISNNTIVQSNLSYLNYVGLDNISVFIEVTDATINTSIIQYNMTINRTYQCEDRIDNDADGYIDYPDDPGCPIQDDDIETDIIQCNDGLDNDGDTAFDLSDSDCDDQHDDSEYGTDDSISSTETLFNELAGPLIIIAVLIVIFSGFKIRKLAGSK